MSRMIDRILAGQAHLPGYWKGEPPPPSLVSLMGSAPVIFADNVVSYMFEATDKEEWDAEDFPSLAPPFETMWIEAKSPTSINSKGVQRPVPATMPIGMGALFMSSVDERTGVPWKWEIHALPFEEYRGGLVLGPMGTCSFRVKDDGTWPNAGATDMRWARAAIPDGGGLVHGTPAANKARDILWWRVKPLMLAISFMNCRNVTRALETPNEALSRKWERKRGRPLVRGYTLNIEPMRSVLRSEGRSAEVGLQRALHICRGHFKDYREKGLFGKHKGMFWWDSAVRGSPEHGIVTKDYRVGPPPLPVDAASRDRQASHPVADPSVGDDRAAPRHTKPDVF